QRRGRKRRRRVTPDRLRLDRGDAVGAGLERGLDPPRQRLVANVEAGDLLAVETNDAGEEAAAVRWLEGDGDRPVFARLESLDLALTVADQAQSNRLHAPSRARAGQFPPQDRRQR